MQKHRMKRGCIDNVRVNVKVNFMQILKIIILVIMVVSTLPIHGYCSDEEESSTEHVCVMVCPTCAHNIVVPAQEGIVLSNVTLSSVYFSTYRFTYENPTRLGFKRPPVLSA